MLLLIFFFAFAKAADAQVEPLVSPQEQVRDTLRDNTQKATLPKPTSSGRAPQDTLRNSEASGANPSKIGKKLGALFTYKNGLPNPRKALLFSIVLPGAGQIYNGDWWKAPIAMAAVGTSVYFYLDTQQNFVRYRDAFIARQAGENPSGFENLSTSVIGNFRDRYDNRRQYALLAVIATNFFQAGEAFSAAHLASFEVSEDLSLQIKQSAEPTFLAGPALGLAVRVNW